MKFDLHRLDSDGVTFRHFDSERIETALITIERSAWERMGRPTSITGGFASPSEHWFVELNAEEDPTIWDGDEPVLSRSDAPGHWDELVARLGIAP